MNRLHVPPRKSGSPGPRSRSGKSACLRVESSHINYYSSVRTEVMRNLYLAIAFVLVLYSLYRALPASYVALSWTVAAVCYFGLSLLLRNIKYRWMAIFQLLATVLYLFFVDLARLDPRYRVVAFLFLGLMALGISLSYSKLRRLLGRNESHREKDAV